MIAFNTNRVSRVNVPTKLRDLTDDKWRGKVGMARPQFGTTRTQIAALVALHGLAATREWLQAMQDNGIKLYDGNSGVVTALRNGEIEVGLTDTDDVWARQERLGRWTWCLRPWTSRRPRAGCFQRGWRASGRWTPFPTPSRRSRRTSPQ